MNSFGGTFPNGDGLAVCDYLEHFTAEHWDFRAGRERNQATEAELTSDQEQLVIQAAHALGMVEPQPPQYESFDTILVLGGLVRACILRPAMAARLLHQGTRAREVIALGGMRALVGDEESILTSLGWQNLDTEFDVMDRGIREAFHVKDYSTREGSVDQSDLNRSWAITTYESDSLSLRVVAAPSTDPQSRRANTADTYAFWATELRSGAQSARALLITTSIYVPFQHCDAIRMLTMPFGIEVETVGLNTASADIPPALRQDFLPQHYLQELRSTIRSIHSLLGVIAES
ncbi:MAG: hypothetical protein U0U69_05715 [Acidimicrobiia bacterium]